MRILSVKHDRVNEQANELGQILTGIIRTYIIIRILYANTPKSHNSKLLLQVDVLYVSDSGAFDFNSTTDTVFAQCSIYFLTLFPNNEQS